MVLGQSVADPPRRARCAGRKVTQVLLPVGLAGQPADEAAVIAAPLKAKVDDDWRAHGLSAPGCRRCLCFSF